MLPQVDLLKAYHINPVNEEAREFLGSINKVGQEISDQAVMYGASAADKRDKVNNPFARSENDYSFM